MPNTQRIDIETEIVELLAQRDLPMIPVPSRTTAAGSTTTLKDRVLGRGTGAKGRFDGRVIKIIEDVAAAFTNAATVDGAHADATATTLAVDDAQDIEIGHVIEVDGSEKMLVTNISTNDLTVVRGYWGTTAAAYSGGETVHFAFLGCVVAVDDQGFDETDTLTVSPAFAIATLAGMEYLPYPKGLTPEIVTKAINRVLKATDAPHLWVPSLVPDSDFGGNDIALWTGIDTPVTLEFDTDPADVLFGERSIYCTGTTDAGFKSSTWFHTYPREQLLCSAYIRGMSDAKFDFRLTNQGGAVRESATCERTEWVNAQFLYTTSDDLLDIRLEVRFICGEPCAFHVSPHVVVQSAIRRAYVLPSWLASESKIVGAFYLPKGVDATAGLYDENVYAAFSQAPKDALGLRVLRSARDINPMRLEMKPDIGKGVLFLECLRPFPELSYDSETTRCDPQYLKYKAISLILNDRGDDDSRRDGRHFAKVAASRAETLRYGERGIRIEESQVYV